jgi:hypothetical protein
LDLEDEVSVPLSVATKVTLSLVVISKKDKIVNGIRK